MKKVSVIIPCYNAEEYLSQCLESLIRQTIGVETLDIICVDDAFSDGTGKLLDVMEEQYPDIIRVFHLPENRKQGGARNEGLARSLYIIIGCMRCLRCTSMYVFPESCMTMHWCS